ncbi:MAG: SCO6745 family protein [Actinomycetota bacterium]
MTDWVDLTARASFASHRLVGWIYWDPQAIAAYTALGVPEGRGYYIASRCAPLGPAGNDVVAAACYSIHPVFVAFSLDQARQYTTFEAVYEARNDAVVRGLREYAPDICDGLAALATKLWSVADALPLSARPLFAAHLHWARHEADPLLSAWLAVNCIREWRGDTHWAVLAAEGISGVEAGLLHDAYLGYPGDWIPRSRGADDPALETAWANLETRGLAVNHRVTDAGVAFREHLELRTNELASMSWRHLGEVDTRAVISLIEPVGQRFIDRINATAGPEWMPAARERRPRS